jgi:hypothetical protein
MLRHRQIFEDEMEQASEIEDRSDRILIESSHGNGLKRQISHRSSCPSTCSLHPLRLPFPEEHEP